LIALLAALAAASSALGAFPGGNGRLVVEHFDGTAWELLTLDADGGAPAAVPLPVGLSPAAPAWSPDGERIAFSDSGTDDVWVVRPDGSDLTMVTAAGGSGVAWSPDGTRLAVRGPGGIDQVVVATGARTAIVPAGTELPGGGFVSGHGAQAWSPDGATIAFNGSAPGSLAEELFLVQVASGDITRLTTSPLIPDAYPGGNFEPDWAPSGDTLVFRCTLPKYWGDVCRLDATGGNLAILTETAPYSMAGVNDDQVDHRSPALSPDGTRLAATVDYGIAVADADGSGWVQIAAPSGDVYGQVDWQPIAGGGNPDTDGDGVANAIDTGAGTFADDNAPPTAGAILDRGGLDVVVADATAPDGVTVTTAAGPAGARARLQVCGFTVLLAPGSSATFTCGSLAVRTTGGLVEVVSANGAQFTPVPAGAAATFTATTGGGYAVTGASAGLRVFQGFDAPVDNGGVLNEVKAGRAIPLKWRVLTAAGAPVTSIAAATVTAATIPCAAGQGSDAIEESLPDGSGLKNHGNGNYSINWKSPTSFAGTCKRVKVDLGGGLAPTALFRFTR
jgi:hypothetical protein